MSHAFGIKAKKDLGYTLSTSGALVGNVAAGPVGAVVVGAFSGALSVCVNGVSKLACHT